MKSGKRYSRPLALRVGALVLRNPKDRGLIKFLAGRLGVTPQTIHYWVRLARLDELPKIGRPRASKERRSEAEALVRVEMQRQGNPGWRPIAAKLPWLPLRLVQANVKKVKLEREQRRLQNIEEKRVSVEVLAREAIWTIDGTQTKSAPNEKQFNQVIKDRGSLAYRAILSGEPAKAEDITNLLEAMPMLPLVIGSDNDRIYCGERTRKWLEDRQVIHLRSLPRTPQHNGAMEIAMRELKDVAGESAYISSESLVAAAKQLNISKLRGSKGYKTSTVLDAELPVAYSRVTRAEFYQKCRERLSRIDSGPMEWREKRMAEREIIYATLEEYGLIKRTGGDGSVISEKAKIFL